MSANRKKGMSGVPTHLPSAATPGYLPLDERPWCVADGKGQLLRDGNRELLRFTNEEEVLDWLHRHNIPLLRRGKGWS